MGPKVANRPPLFSIVLAGWIAVCGTQPAALAVLGSLLGAGRVAAVGLLGRRLVGARVGLVAAALAACYPYWVVNDPTLLENALLGGFVALATWAVAGLASAPTARTALAAGALFGLAALTRESVNLAMPLVALWVLCSPPSAALRPRLVRAGLLTIAFFAVCSPWLAYTTHRFGVPAFSLSAGKSLWVGNNAHTFEHYPERTIDIVERAAWKALDEEQRAQILSLREDERAQDAVFRGMAFERISTHPGEFVARMPRKVWASFSPGLIPPAATTPKAVVYSVSWLLLVAAALLGWRLVRERLRPYRLLLAAPYVSAALLSGVFWGQARLRVGYDFVLLVPAAVLVVALLDRARCRASSRV